MTRLDAIRGQLKGKEVGLGGMSWFKTEDVAWLVETVDILRASIESTSVLLSELGHSEEHLNRPEETVCLGVPRLFFCQERPRPPGGERAYLMPNRLAALARKWYQECWKRHHSVGACEECLIAALREALEKAENQFADETRLISLRTARARVAALRQEP